MLTQLLPSSTVAAGVRLKVGLGIVASAMPGATLKPSPPFSGGTREPLQYWLTTPGLAGCRLCAPPPYPVVSVRIDEVGWSVNPDEWLVGPVSPRTPMSQ